MDKNISSFIYAFVQGKNEEAYIHTERERYRDGGRNIKLKKLKFQLIPTGNAFLPLELASG